MAVDALELLPVRRLLKIESHQPQPDAVDEAQGLELEQIEGGDEVIDGAVVVEADLGLDPGQLLSEAQLVDQVDHVGVALEQMMVAALQAAVANVEGRGLAPYKRSRFIDLHRVALLKQLVCCGEARGPGSYHAYIQSLGSPSIDIGPPAPAPAVTGPPRTSSIRERCSNHRYIMPATTTGSHSTT